MIKSVRYPTDLTVVFDYTSPHIEQYICRLTRRMSNILPNFHRLCYIAYRTIKVTKYALNYHNKFTSPNKAKFAFFKSRFSVVKKGFRSEFARKKCEAYHIRVKRPTINDQNNLKAFTLF